MTNEFTVKNSFNFAEEVVNYDHNLYMASVDVELLFINIPLEESVSMIYSPIIFILVNEVEKTYMI